MKGRQIEHRGVVERVMSHAVIVAIEPESACSACAAAQLCHSSEKKEKRVEVPVRNVGMLHVGQEVTLVGEVALGLRATLWAYGVPLALLMSVLMLGSRLIGNEGQAAVVALLSLIPYYIILYLLRNRLQRRFQFRIKSQTH